MKYKVSAIITAAGSGRRFNKEKKTAIPKQFVLLKGKPVILYSLVVFQKCKQVDEIIVSADKKYFNLLHNIAVKNGITKLTCIVEGGETRFESVRNAFMQAVNTKGRLVMVHDAARPNIDLPLIERLISERRNYDGIVPGIKIPETVKRAQKGIVTETLNREDLYTVQTPQLFKYDALLSAYLKSSNKNDYTDEASLAEYAGYKIRITEGKKGNIKITTAEDIKLLKLLM